MWSATPRGAVRWGISRNYNRTAPSAAPFSANERQVFSIVAGALGGEVGCGLYLEAAPANHSCSPNASQSFDGKTLSLRCTRPIARGEEITIGITQIQRPGPVRRESLRSNYFFECRCERCAHDEPRTDGGSSVLDGHWRARCARVYVSCPLVM